MEKQRWSAVVKTLQEYTTPAAGAKASGRMSLDESSDPLSAWCRGCASPPLQYFLPLGNVYYIGYFRACKFDSQFLVYKMRWSLKY